MLNAAAKITCTLMQLVVFEEEHLGKKIFKFVLFWFEIHMLVVPACQWPPELAKVTMKQVFVTFSIYFWQMLQTNLIMIARQSLLKHF